MWVVGDRFVIDESYKPRAGGMAEVYKAVDIKTAKLVAVKLFDPRLCKDERLALEAFSRETQSLHELNEHPHIAKILDCGTDKETDRRYIALEWLEHDLVARLKEHPPAGWDDFYQKYGRSILEALRYAFSRQVLHRDVKPSNILLDDDSNIKVVDFGISKFNKYYRPGVTLYQFASPPYAPPELESGAYPGTRDVYSFAILSMEALSETPFDSNLDVHKALSDFDAPPEIHAVIERCLDPNPESRPSNVVELFEEIEALQRKRESSGKHRISCYIKLTRNAFKDLSQDLDIESVRTAEEWVAKDLNEIVGINQWQYIKDGVYEKSNDHLMFCTAQYRYQAKVDESNPDRFAILKAIQGVPAKLESQRERAWRPSIEFRIGAPPADHSSRQSVEFVLNELEEFLSDQKREDARRREDGLLDKWVSILRFQESLQQELEDRIEFHDYEIDGQRIIFETNSIPGRDIIDQDRIVRVNDRPLLSGIVEQVTDSSVTLYCESGLATAIPKTGHIVFDTTKTRMAIQRQHAALDAVRYDRSVRPDMRRLLADPSRCREPADSQISEFFQSDLDEYKRSAVNGALSSRDFYIVEGPPGAGKTKFIAELILQAHVMHPEVKVLVTSQTHNALDNAIERVQQIAYPGRDRMRIVRIARKTDPRVAAGVRDLLLERQVEKWLSDVRKASEKYLDGWAAKQGLDKAEISMGLAVAKLRNAIRAHEDAVSEISHIDSQIEQFETERNLAIEGLPSARTMSRIESDLDAARRDGMAIAEDVVRTRRARDLAKTQLQKHGEVAVSLAGSDASELEAWEELLLEGSSSAKRCKQVIELLEEWYERFGRSADFHASFLADANVVAGTCVGFMKREFQDIEFDLCIVDEASKATPPEALVPAVRAKRWVVVGDPRQLPPFVAEGRDDQVRLEKFDLRREDLRHTLLDHLIMNVPASCHAVLKKQYRMSKPIGDLISACFYENQLESHAEFDFQLDAFHALPRPVTWFSTSRSTDCMEQKVRKSFKNNSEVQVAKRFVLRLEMAAKHLGKKFEVAILAGYLPQVKEMQRMIAALTDVRHLSVECNTVDSYQGRETDVVVYSIVRSNSEGKIGFLKERERLNVALSRCRYGLAIVGDSAFFQRIQGENPLSDVLSHIRSNPHACALVEAEQ